MTITAPFILIGSLLLLLFLPIAVVGIIVLVYTVIYVIKRWRRNKEKD